MGPLELTRQLLHAISARDWEVYAKLCSPDLTCFEPEARGQLVAGLPFHRYYFEPGPDSRVQNTICSPVVHWLGEDAAVVAYTRVVQTETGSTAFEETRVWRRERGEWRHIHFHRSLPA